MRRGSECELSSEVELRLGRERVRAELRGGIASGRERVRVELRGGIEAGAGESAS